MTTKNKKMKSATLFAVLLISILSVGCTFTAANDPKHMEDSSLSGENTSGFEKKMIADQDETAKYMELTLSKAPYIYIADLKKFEEFGSINEGTVSLYEDENLLEFVLTKGTGTVTGAIDGPVVYFKMDLRTNGILEKEFVPAPKFTNPEQVQFSGEVLEIQDKRLVEIGLYFKDLFNTYL